MNCRGDNSRIRIVQENEVVPIAHVRLLNGQSKKSCTGDRLTKSYYYFSYKNRNNTSKEGYIVCGSHAAEHFLSLLNAKPLKEFNPLTSDPEKNTSSSYINDNGSDKIRWHPLSEELNNAINLLLICWNKIPYGKLLEIKLDLDKYPSFEPFFWKIKHVNSCISKDAKNRTLMEMIEELRIDNPNLKSYSFPNINAELKKNGIKSFIG